MSPSRMYKAAALLVAHWGLRAAGFTPVYEIRRRDTLSARGTLGTLVDRFPQINHALMRRHERAKQTAEDNIAVSIELRCSLLDERGTLAADSNVVCGTFVDRAVRGPRPTAKAYGTVITPEERQK